MKRHLFYLFLLPLLLVLPGQGYAWDWNYCCDWSTWSRPNVSVNFRASYFHPFSERVKRIYSDGWTDYGLEFAANWDTNWQLWTAVSGFSQEGRSIGFHHDTRLSLVPLSLGFKYLFCPLDSVQFYLGAGICYSWIRIHDHSYFVHEHTNLEAFGGVAQIGLYFYWKCLLINFFIDYLYQRFDFRHKSYNPYVERHDLDISGIKIGGGIGFIF